MQKAVEIAAPSRRMTFAEYRYLVGSDLYRKTGRISAGLFLKHALFGQGFRYMLWLRTCWYLRARRWGALLLPFARLMLRHYSYKFGIHIPDSTRIGSGFYIGHFGTIVVNSRAMIGDDCNISHGVTIGQVNGRRRGYPTIGDRVYLGAGAKVLGNVRIGNDVVVGANAVVTRDVPPGAVVAGIPAQIVSMAGSADYVTRRDYVRRKF